MEKQCFKCSQFKELSDFYKHPGTRDGHLNKCKKCTRSDSKARYDDPESRERIRLYDKMRFKLPERKAKILNYQRERRRRDPEKYIARYYVSQAVKNGALVKQPCAVCGSKKSQAHHLDYSRPLDVVWLCFFQHRTEHGQKPLN